MKSLKSGRTVRAALLLGVALSVAACAAADADPGVSRAREGISGGSPDSVDSNVFLLVSHRGKGVALCSASLIAPNLLLTARHCVSDVSEEHVMCGQTMASAPFAVSTFYAANSPSIEDVGPTYKVSAVSVPNDGSDICGFDIALVTLATPVPAKLATPLVPRVDRPVSGGEQYSAVGFGLDTPGDGGIAGRRRARAGLAVSCIPGSCGLGVEQNEFVGGAGICSGDSGGPALDGTGKVVGVVSRSGSDCAHPVYGSVAAWKDWISGVARDAALQGGYSAPFWVESGSSDAPPQPEGSAGSDASDPAGTQGFACVGARDCASGFACYSPTNSATDGHCAGLCSTQADCASGSTCTSVGGGRVCTGSTATSHDATSSCAVVRASSGSTSDGGTVLSLVAFALVGYSLRPRRGRRAVRVTGDS